MTLYKFLIYFNMAGCNCKGDKSKLIDVAQKPKGFLGSKFVLVISIILFIPIILPIIIFIGVRQRITGKGFDITKFINKNIKPSAKKVEEKEEIDNPEDYELVGI